MSLAIGELSLDGIIVTPGKTTPGLFQKTILERVEQMMRLNKLCWGKEEYRRKKTWPWHTLENVDRLANKIKLVRKNGETEPEQSARRLLPEYSKA